MTAPLKIYFVHRGLTAELQQMNAVEMYRLIGSSKESFVVYKYTASDAGPTSEMIDRVVPLTIQQLTSSMNSGSIKKL